LQAGEFLYETHPFPEQQYTFKHALTHEVAYGSLLLEQQCTMHACIVDALEGLYAGHLAEQVERLAHHALRGAVWDKACAYSQQAGARALDQSAHRAAVVSYEQALAALEHLPQERETLAWGIDLHLALRQALVALHENEREISHLHTAETRAMTLNDPRRLGLIYSSLVGSYRATSNTERVLTYSQRCQALATTSGDLEIQIMSSLRLGQFYYDLGDYQRAMACFRSNVASLQGALRYKRFSASTDSALPSLTSLTYLALCLAEVGEFAEGITDGDEALRLVEGVDRRYDRVVVPICVGRVHLRQGNVTRAIPLLEQALALSQATDVRTFFSDNATALAVAYALAGRVADTAPLLEHMPQRTYEVLRYSEAYLLVGRVAEARQLAQRALAHACDHHEQGHQAQALWLIGEVAMYGDPPEIEQAAVHYRQALALADELGMRPLQAHCYHGLGMLHTTMGQWQQARAELSAAITLYRAMEMTFWLLSAEAALAQVEER
jgi:tetratricopeptide (TPR) repeat protein